MSMTLPGQTLKTHIENGDISAVISLLKAGNINLDERDNVWASAELDQTATRPQLLGHSKGTLGHGTL